MNQLKTIKNSDGEVWQVEEMRSGRLKNIGGYLMTYSDIGRITLSAELDGPLQVAGRAELLRRLEQLPVGTSGVILWHPDD